MKEMRPVTAQGRIGKGRFMMNREMKDRMSGAAMGMLAGATVGAMGMYLNARHPRQVKKALKRAGKEAEKAMMMVEKALH